MRTLIIIMLILSSFSLSAKEGGNGGGTHDCGTTIELYDFFEGRDPRQWNLPVWNVDPKLSVDDYLAKAMDHIKNDIPDVFERVNSMLTTLRMRSYNDLVVDIEIPLIQDVVENDDDVFFVNEGCSYVQAANWNERFKKVYFSKAIFERLDNMSKAGLYIHEAIYKISRDSHVAVNSSHKVRLVVAKIFSSQALTEKDSIIIYDESSVSLYNLRKCLQAVDLMNDANKIYREDLRSCRQASNKADLVKLQINLSESKEIVQESAGFCLKLCSETRLGSKADKAVISTCRYNFENASRMNECH